MREIKVLGPGCHKCTELAELIIKVADQLGIEYNFEKIQDINAIMSYGVMFTPALIIDGKIKVTGKVPSIEELKELLQ